MEIRVLFFGATAAAVGTHEVTAGVGDAPSLIDLINQLVSKYPQLKSHKLLFAVNQEYAAENTVLNAGDDVAIFTAVSGG